MQVLRFKIVRSKGDRDPVTIDVLLEACECLAAIVSKKMPASKKACVLELAWPRDEHALLLALCHARCLCHPICAGANAQ